MKLPRKTFFGIMLFPFVALAGLECTDWNCDVKWRTKMGEIDLSSVCYNHDGKSSYGECRKLAAKVFAERCARGRDSDNPVWIEVYCSAQKNYKP